MIENDKLLFLGFVGVIVIIWYILFVMIGLQHLVIIQE